MADRRLPVAGDLLFYNYNWGTSFFPHGRWLFVTRIKEDSEPLESWHYITTDGVVFTGFWLDTRIAEICLFSRRENAWWMYAEEYHAATSKTTGASLPNELY